MPKEFCTVPDACSLAKKRGIAVSEVTIRYWCKKYKLGHQLGGKWSKWAVNTKKLEKFFDGKT